MNKRDKLTESAAAGAVSATSIAVRQDAGGSHPHGMRRREGLLDFLASYQKKPFGNSLNMKPVEKPFKVSVNEDVSLDQIYSRMSGIENASRRDQRDSVTYGVEDDNGNLMKITVNASNAEDFEVALAQELGEVEAYKMTGRGGYGRDVSMAEVLFNLKQKFDIIDVEFPEIPKDKVYNADKVSDLSDLDTDLDLDSDLPMDGKMDSPEGEDFDMDSPEGEEGDLDSSLDLDSEEGEEDLDSDIGAELTDTEDDEESILKQIVKMMAADAEAKKAQHEAEAEKYRAMQAEYAMKAAKQEMYKQEELLQMEEEKDKQRKKEEEARKLADLARFRMRGSVSEGASSFLAMLAEISDLEDETTLRMQRRNTRNIEDPRERALQNQLINNKRRIIQRREQLRQQQDRQDNQPNEQDREDRQQQNAQRNQPVPDRRPIGGSNV